VSPGGEASPWEQAILWLRAQPDQIEIIRAGYYDDPLVIAAQRYEGSEEWHAVRRLLPDSRGCRALEVGAGRGIVSYALARAGFAVTALEPDGSAIVGAHAIRRLASETHLRIEVIQEYSEDLPFPSQHFDLVFARAVLHHTASLERACSEFFRVLKPGGRLIAIREHVISHPQDLAAFLAAHPLHRLYGGENAFPLRDYVQAIRGAGFPRVRVLSPFESAINLAPSTPASILQQLAERVSGGNQLVRRALATAFAVRGSWAVVRTLLRMVDNRPGRLYSFIAVRP
jgi:SAM-dependent methyltransferase